MMEDFVTNIGLILRVMSLSIFFVGLIPRMYRETRVKDGLTIMRYGILVATVVYVLMHITFFTANALRSLNIISDQALPWLSFLNSISSLIISVILYIIYTRKYKEPYL